MQERKQLKPLTSFAQKQVSGGDIVQPGETWDEAHDRLFGGTNGGSPQEP